MLNLSNSTLQLCKTSASGGGQTGLASGWAALHCAGVHRVGFPCRPARLHWPTRARARTHRAERRHFALGRARGAAQRSNSGGGGGGERMLSDEARMMTRVLTRVGSKLSGQPNGCDTLALNRRRQLAPAERKQRAAAACSRRARATRAARRKSLIKSQPLGNCRALVALASERASSQTSCPLSHFNLVRNF